MDSGNTQFAQRGSDFKVERTRNFPGPEEDILWQALVILLLVRTGSSLPLKFREPWDTARLQY
jgi:hypothetical protein